MEMRGETEKLITAFGNIKTLLPGTNRSKNPEKQANKQYKIDLNILEFYVSLYTETFYHYQCLYCLHLLICI